MKNQTLILLFLFLLSCNGPSVSPLYIAASANAQFAMQKITGIFEQETGIHTELITGSSGKLTAQIKQGAPFDIFISANLKYPLELYQSGFTTAAPEIYARGKLVLWTIDNHSTTSLDSLSSNRIEKVAVANPRTAPYGMAAEEVLKFYGTYEKVKPKLVYGESISQTNQFIISKTVDMGFTAKSVVLAPKLKGKGHWIEVPKESYSPIEQGVVIVKREGESRERAGQFYRFLFSGKAQQILEEYGYVCEE